MKAIFAGSLLFLTGVCWAADEVAVSGREVLKRSQDAVITVRLVIKSSYAGRESRQENRVETTGVVLDPSGLTVVSLSAVDPAEMMNRVRVGGGEGDGKYESELTDVKLLLADETEIAAEVVLRDKDLDLAYLRPTDKLSRSITPVDTSATPCPLAMEAVIVLKRLGKVANRVATASEARIETVVEKPREFYVLAQASTVASLGSPVFSLDGKLLGVVLMRTIKASSDTGAGMGRTVLPVIIPTADILDGAKQASSLQKP